MCAAVGTRGNGQFGERMKVGIPKERRPDEARVAGSPDLVKRLSAVGIDVLVERGAGEAALIPDDVLAEAGATVLADAAGVYGDSDVVLKVRRPLT